MYSIFSSLKSESTESQRMNRGISHPCSGNNYELNIGIKLSNLSIEQFNWRFFQRLLNDASVRTITWHTQNEMYSGWVQSCRAWTRKCEYTCAVATFAKNCSFNTNSFLCRFCTWEDFYDHINANNTYQNWNSNEKLLRTFHPRFPESIQGVWRLI